MDAPKNSANGVAQVFAEVATKWGTTMQDMAKPVQVVAGDLGTCQRIKSLRKKRFPSGSVGGGLENIVTIPGVSHVM